MTTQSLHPISFPVRVWLTAGALLLTLLLIFTFQSPVAAQQAITVPLTQVIPTVDGACSVANNEYGDAFSATFADAFATTGTIFLKHDGTNLYVCMRGASSVNSTVGPFAAVYLDTDNGKESLAEADDLSLRVAIQTDANSAHRGDGAGSYTPDPTITGWNANASTGNLDQAEWQIPLSLVSQQCGNPFGIAIYHQSINNIGDDYGWPSNQFPNSPKTWQPISLAGITCNPDLTVTKDGVYDPATGHISYTISLKNNGSVAATDVKLVDTLPAEAHFVSSTPGAPTCVHSGEFLGGTLTCTLGTMNPGDSQSIPAQAWR